MLKAEDLLKEIEQVLPTVTWKESACSGEAAEYAARFHEGAVDGWHFVLCTFSIEDQGFPAGSRGWDGTARKGSVVLRLPHELANKAVQLAENKGSTP